MTAKLTTSGMMLILRQRLISLWRLPSEAPASSLVVSRPMSSRTANIVMPAPMPSTAMLVMLVMLAGWLATRSLQNMSPLRILRGE